MKRSKLVTQLTNAVAQATNQTWPDDRHVYRAIRQAIDAVVPACSVVAPLTDAQANALAVAANYRLEFAGEGDHAGIIGSHGKALARAVRALAE